MIEPNEIVPYFPWDCIKVKYIQNENLREKFPNGICFRLIMVSAGAGIVEINGVRSPFSSPALFCINELEEIILSTTGQIESFSLHFDPIWINPNFSFTNLRSPDFKIANSSDMQDRYYLLSFLNREKDYKGLLNCTPETYITLRENFEAVFKQLTDKPDGYWPCRSRSYLIQVLIIVSNLFSMQTPTNINEKAAISKEDQLIAEVITYLHNNYSNEIQIQHLEHLFALNRTTLAERFREVTGQSVMSYLRNLRLRAAASLLQETYIPINEVCNRVGFNDLSHFGRTFREVYDLTPKEYREQFCWVGK